MNVHDSKLISTNRPKGTFSVRLYTLCIRNFVKFLILGPEKEPKMIEKILEIAIVHPELFIISRTIETILLKLSTIVLHFMRIVYKKFRQVPNFRSCGFPPICFLPNL